MDISFYHMGDIYRKKVLLREFTNTPTNDVKNSYQVTASMSGPGNGPSTGARDSDTAQFGDKVMFPDDEEFSDSKKAEMLIKFFKKEIDEGTWNDETKSHFEKLMHHLLGFSESEEEDNES